MTVVLTEEESTYKEVAPLAITSQSKDIYAVHPLQMLDFSGMVQISLQRVISSIDDAKTDATFRILRYVDQILNTRLHDAAIVEHHAKGLSMSQPDAFLEQFRYLPAEIFDQIFVNLPARQIPSLKRVCQSWNHIIETRRYKYPKIHHSRLEIDMGKEINSITTGSDKDVFGLFGGGRNRSFPLYFSDVCSHIHIDQLKINIHSDIPMLSTLSLSTTSIHNLHIQFYQIPERSILEELSEMVALNEEILSVRMTFPKNVPTEDFSLSEMFSFENRSIKLIVK